MLLKNDDKSVNSESRETKESSSQYFQKDLILQKFRN